MIRMQVIGKVVVVAICLLSYGCTNNDIVGDPLTYAFTLLAIWISRVAIYMEACRSYLGLCNK